MVSQEEVLAQLKRIGFNENAWGRAEVRELHNILIPEETIFECVNGIYEGGFALLVATDVRVLLIDKKPFKFLTVEDLRFDMINEIDYNHRLMGAYVGISTGNRDLRFRSYNQPRLRKLIGHVQHCMAAAKKKEASHQEGQNQHLEQINERLQSYLRVQHEYQQQLQERLRRAQEGNAQAKAIDKALEAPRLDPELSDYLLAQNLLTRQGPHDKQGPPIEDGEPPVEPPQPIPGEDLYTAGIREVFGDDHPAAHHHSLKQTIAGHNPFDGNPLKIAYSKLPVVLHSKKLGHALPHPSLHLSVSAEPTAVPQTT